jgi:hypothetical protein
MIEELNKIADEMDALLPLFRDGGSMSGLILPTEHAATFKALAIETKSILDSELGLANDYSLNLLYAINSGTGFSGGPSYASIEEASKIVRAAVRAVVRKQSKPLPLSAGVKPYVDYSRIAALQKRGAGDWDFTRLIELCREINVASANRCHLSTAMLLRTILNHVPPILGFNTFAEVANSYGGAKSQKSFKGSMQRLEGSLRNIADMHLHSPIRPREDVPTAVQVDFAAELDVLLGEVIRLCDSPR